MMHVAGSSLSLTVVMERFFQSLEFKFLYLFSCAVPPAIVGFDLPPPNLHAAQLSALFIGNPRIDHNDAVAVIGVGEEYLLLCHGCMPNNHT